MSGFLSSVRGTDTTGFDAYDEFVPDTIPAPGRFLADHAVLTGREHAAFHRLARSVFEQRGVYDMTFGYNLARLNLDQRHPDAGYRYAIDAEDTSVLLAEFTPTTEFCPQSDTLTVGSFRAFNGESERHQFNLVRVRVDRMHHRAAEINDKLRDLEETLADSSALENEETSSHPSDNPQAQTGDTPF